MKKLFSILLPFISVQGYSQYFAPLDAKNSGAKSVGILAIDSMHNHKYFDTATCKLSFWTSIPNRLNRIARQNGRLYIYNGTYFEPLDNVPSGTGTVSSVGGVDANGFIFNILNPTTTPVIVLNTSVSGVVKGNGSGFIAATAGTDYVAPSQLNDTAASIRASFPIVTGKVNYTDTAAMLAPYYRTATAVAALALKQDQLNGLGFAKINGTTITYDNSTYLTAETDPVARAINGILYSNGSTLSAAIAGNFPILNQNTTGSAATMTTSRNIHGGAYNGSADVTNVIAGTYGGTGVNNATRLLTYAGNVTYSGAFASTFTLTGTTTVTLPTTGTLATLSGTENFTNKSFPSLSSGTTNDSILVADAATGAVKRISSNRIAGNSGWSLTGNAGTTPGTNYIGTNDANGLVFKTNGSFSGQIDYSNTYSVRLGFNAGPNASGNYNTIIGGNAAGGANSGLNTSVIIGTSALGGSFSSASRVICIGADAEPAALNTSGQLNLGNVLWGSGTNGSGTTPAGSLSVGINTPAASSKLHIASTTQGVLLCPMTNAQKGAIASPGTGLEVYCTDCIATDASTGVKQVYNGTTWKNCW